MDDLLKQKLEIAIKALRHYAQETHWQLCRTDSRLHKHYDHSSRGYYVAQEALNRIAELEKDETATLI